MTDTTAPRRRRWFSISLRGLMVLVLIVGGGLGWQARRASIQRQAVARIEELGGSVRYDWQGEFDPFGATEPDGPNVPGWLRRAVGDAYFQEVAFVQIRDFSSPLFASPTAFSPVILTGEALKAEDERKRRVELVYQELVKDQLACVEPFDRLESFTLVDPRLGPTGLARLGRMTQLKSFLSVSPQDPEIVDAIGRLRNLESLAVNLSEIAPAPDRLACLDRLPKLKSLSLRGDYEATDAELVRIGRLDRLEELDLDSSAITDAGLAHLARLKQLYRLALGSATVTDQGIEHLAGLDKLQTLTAPMASLTDAGLAKLNGLRKLTELEIASTELTDAGASHLVKLTELSFLRVSDGGLTEVGLGHLSTLPKLVNLVLINATIADEALTRFQRSKPGLVLTIRRPGQQAQRLP